MDRLEKYIKDNTENFDTAMQPAGCRERFLEYVRKEDRRHERLVRLSFAGTAAAAVAVLMLALTLTLDRESRELERNFRALAKSEAELMELVDRNYPEEKQIVMNTIRSITGEAIPLADQLPQELGQNERIEILKKYYGQQAEALAMLMDEYK